MPDGDDTTNEQRAILAEALLQRARELVLAEEVERSMTVTCMRCYGTGRMPISQPEPDENGTMKVDGLEGMLEFFQSQHMDIQPGEVDDEAARKLLADAGVLGAIITMHNNGFSGDQSRDVLYRAGLSEAQIEAELDDIQRRASGDDDENGEQFS